MDGDKVDACLADADCQQSRILGVSLLYVLSDQSIFEVTGQNSPVGEVSSVQRSGPR